MDETRCPRCAWPLAELPAPPDGAHRVAHGQVDYRRCVCGSWLAFVNGMIVGATRVS